MLRTLLAFLLICFILNSSAQYEFHWYDEYEVSLDGETLTNAWAGGINCGQLSRIDLNCDGTLDLFVFDRMGNRILTFINQDDSPGAMDYKYVRQYNDEFPALKNWVLLRDFNCDGQQDIFTNKQNGIKVFENVSDSGPLEFELRTESMNSSYNLSGTPFDAVLYCISVDVPSIVDYEGDGDLDIFSFTETSTTVYFYKNQSMEEFGTCDSLNFKTANRCYGQFNEATESSSILFGDDFECDFNVIDPEAYNDSRHSGLHAGGHLLSIDLDQNGLKDLIISDVTEHNMAALMLEEDAEGLDDTFEAHFDFPGPFTTSVPAPVDMRTFPAGYYEDVNNDGVKDLVVSPNTTIDSEDNDGLWLYINNGADDLPDFELVQEDFLQETMIDFGRGAYPVPVDFNLDGLMDLVVSNKEYNEDVDSQPSKLALFENTGTESAPAFNITDMNWLDIPQYGIESVYPAFGDLDNDGDMDMLLGEEGGLIHYFKNIAGEGEPMDMILMDPSIEDANGGDLDIGQFARPILYDMNDDGLLDLLIGEKNGNVNYAENVGSLSEFSFEHMIDTIGDAVASNQLGINGYAIPFIWEDGDGNLQMLYGNEVGSLNHFSDIEGNLDGEFTLEDEMFGGIWEGTFSGACLYDFDNDGLLDLIYGQFGGGLSFYKGGWAPPPTDDCAVSIQEQILPLQFSVYPNPAEHIATIQLPGSGNDRKEIQVLDHLGRVVLSPPTMRKSEITLDLSNLASGTYFVEVGSMGKTGRQKLVVIK
jgi:hypothetical protein